MFCVRLRDFSKLRGRMAITITQLRSFLAVVRTGSVTAAADELVVTQPSISAAVTALAGEVGTPLLEREGRGVRPTSGGAAFAAYAADVIGLLDEGRRAAQEAADPAERMLRIAAVTTAAESFVPELMHRFRTLRPNIGLTLSVGNRRRVWEMVLQHEADVGFGGRPPGDDRIEAHAFRANDLVLIAAADDPLAGGDPVAPDDLRGRPWLLREPGSGTRVGQRGVPGGRRARRAHAHRRLERRHQAVGPRGAGHLDHVARRRGGRGRGRAPRRRST